MEFLRFQQNIPEKIALRFPQGIRKEGVYGPQMFYTLADGRGMYLDEPVAQKLVAANVQPGQEFWLCKRKANGSGKNQRNIWDLYLEDPTPQPAESQIERDLRLSLGNVDRAKQAIEHKVEQHQEQQEASIEQQPAAAPSNVRTIDAAPRKKAPARAETLWTDKLLAHTKALTDVYAKAIQHASESAGPVVKSEDVRTFVVTTYINMSQRGKTA